jgi:hypothetical protein
MLIIYRTSAFLSVIHTRHKLQKNLYDVNLNNGPNIILRVGQQAEFKNGIKHVVSKTFVHLTKSNRNVLSLWNTWIGRCPLLTEMRY